MPYPSIPRGPGGSPLPVRWNSTAGNWEVLEGTFVDSNLNEAELKQADDGSYLLGTAGYGTTGSGVLIPRKVTDDGYDIMRQTGSIVAVNSDGSLESEQPKEYRFESGSTKPTGDIPKFSTLIEMDGTNEYYYDGTQWVLM